MYIGTRDKKGNVNEITHTYVKKYRGFSHIFEQIFPLSMNLNLDVEIKT